MMELEIRKMFQAYNEKFKKQLEDFVRSQSKFKEISFKLRNNFTLCKRITSVFA
jgi:hypothetical protein